MPSLYRTVAISWLLLQTVFAIDLTIDDPDSVKAAASIAAAKLVSYYSNNGVIVSGIPGLLPGPYYWWEAGGMFGTLIDYWANTGDTQYNNMITQALQFQVGPQQNYEPPNETLSLGNDDQAFWAMAALSAAENNFPNPPLPTDPSWLALAQAVFNRQILRWDTSTCAGGLHWQIFQANTGYDLKNSISNGCLMQIAARLARYTGDPDGLYAPWTEKIWDWMVHVALIDENYSVYDNTEATILNCTQTDKHQWTYNAATLLVSAATMYNITEDPVWKNRTSNLLSTLVFDFFPNGILKDICEQANACNNDEKSFKAYVTRWMAVTTQMANFTYDIIHPLLVSSAIAAAQQCSGGADGTTCGLNWFQNATYDGTEGVGQQMSAMEVFLSTLVKDQPAPLTNATGGTSVGNPTAGNATTDTTGAPGPATTAGKGGAWFLTVFLAILSLFLVWFLTSTAFESRGSGPAVRNQRRRRLEKGKGTAGESEVLNLSRGSVGVLPTIGEKSVPVHHGGILQT